MTEFEKTAVCNCVEVRTTVQPTCESSLSGCKKVFYNFHMPDGISRSIQEMQNSTTVTSTGKRQGSIPACITGDKMRSHFIIA